MSIALESAEIFAAAAHGDQKYGELPYVKHLAHVVEVLKRFGIIDEDLLVAGWLHDVAEDTSTSLFQIEAAYGKRVADLVYRVTNEVGKNRRERHEKTYPKIAENNDAITLKLADRIANVESCIDLHDDKIHMYIKEHKTFKEKLYKPGTHDAMWRHIDFLIGSSDE